MKRGLFAGILAACLVLGNSSVIDTRNDDSKNIVTRENIVYGVPVDVNKFPYMVAIVAMSAFQQASLICGGSVISAEWVLSAAHCTLGVQPGQVYINAGSSKWYEFKSLHKVETFVVHEDFGQYGLHGSYVNDIALFKISPPFNSAISTSRVSLPPASSYEWQLGVITGWGQTGYGLSAQLLATNVHRVPTHVCQQVFQAVPPGTLCAVHTTENFRSSPCNGDSGSPLVAAGHQVGVVSSGLQGCQPGAPVMYVDVSTYTAWIHRATGTSLRYISTV